MDTREQLAPPVAPKEPKVLELHGDRRVDDYFWLRTKDDPRVRAYLEEENAYTRSVLGHTESFQEDLFAELRGRIQETDTSAGVKRGDYYYYRRTEEGLQYPIFCRRQGSMDGAEEILLDQNALADGHDYHALGGFEVSEDHGLLAYSEDVDGSESYTLRIKDLGTGELLPDTIEGTYYGLEWGNDGRHLYYTVHDEAMRPHRLYRHRLGAAQSTDELVFEEPDEAFFLSVGKTRSKRFLIVTVASMVTSEVHVADADDPATVFSVVEPRRQGVEYYLEHHGDVFWITTNDEAKNFRLMEAPVATRGRENWTEIIPHRQDVKIDGVEAFAGHMVRSERIRGLTRLVVRALASGEEHEVEVPEPVYGLWSGPTAEFDTTTIRFQYTSLTTPMSAYDYDLETRERTLVKQQPVLGGYDPSAYGSERVFATAADGTQIPISVVYRRDTPRDGTSPLWLYGYGSYGASMDPHFSSLRLTLLDRGFVFAIAHVRGGGELGEPWHDAGKMMEKQNTFTDFIACAEHLVAEEFTASDRLVIEGGSAGGLLVGAAVNLRPDLFFAAVAAVPFVDVLNTILDPSLPLTVIEYEEWGNPNEAEAYNYMRTYSPYDNVEAKDYPHMLVLAGLNDPRVSYWEPAKWVAKLRATKTDSNRLLLKTEMGAGHSGPSGRYDYLKEKALIYAFALDLFDLTGSKPQGAT